MSRLPVWTQDELLQRRRDRELGPHLKAHPLGTIRDLPESVKELARNRKFI